MRSELSKSSLTETIYDTFQRCRRKTLTLFEGIDEATFCHHAHPDFSPIGWHLGHIAYTESLWILERNAGFPCLFPQYRQLFAADGLPKTERVRLPSLEEICFYLDTVRDKVLHYLEVADLEQQLRLWLFILQHESQHSEIITFILELIKKTWGQGDLRTRRLADKETCGQGDLRTRRLGEIYPSPHPPIPYPLSPIPYPLSPEMVEIPAGEFEMGNNSIDALDNERSAHQVYLETYWIDRYPVTCGQYRVFMEAGGYQNPRWWSKVGWQWLQTAQVTQPLYWYDDRSGENHPVCGVSWYEAEAYSQFVGKRLPTEAEWEKAASWDTKSHCRHTYPWGNQEPLLQCNHDNLSRGTTPVNAFPEGKSAYGLYDTLGNVWEWTATWFDGYPDFQSYPYMGYSQVYFDRQHRVLKGGSWATRPWALRCSFRNWYHSNVRQLFAGFRCAKSTNS